MVRNIRDDGASRYLDSRMKRCFDVVACLLLLPPAMIVMGWAAVILLMRERRAEFVPGRFGLSRTRGARRIAPSIRPEIISPLGPVVTASPPKCREPLTETMTRLRNSVAGCRPGKT